jgi:hypothetical protein
VVEGVGDHRVTVVEQRLEHAAVGVEARAVQDRVLLAEEVRQPRLQLLVHLLGAADEADRRHAEAPAVQRLLGGGHDLGMVGQAQVVVGAEVEHLSAAGDGDARALRGGDDPFGLEQSRRGDLVQGRAEVVAEIVEHQAVQSKMILPVLPLAAVSKAASKSR